MEDMNIFGTRENVSSIMGNRVESILGLSARDKINLLLDGKCAKLKEVIKMSEDKQIHSVYPMISENACTIHVSVKCTSGEVSKSWFLPLVREDSSLDRMALVSTDLTEVGITNPEEVVMELNKLIPGIDFMLDGRN